MHRRNWFMALLAGLMAALLGPFSKPAAAATTIKAIGPMVWDPFDDTYYRLVTLRFEDAIASDYVIPFHVIRADLPEENYHRKLHEMLKAGAIFRHAIPRK